MKKTYMIPTNKVVELDLTDGILNPVSGGVTDGATLLDDFNSDDVSYTKKESFNLWNQEW